MPTVIATPDETCRSLGQNRARRTGCFILLYPCISVYYLVTIFPRRKQIINNNHCYEQRICHHTSVLEVAGLTLLYHDNYYITEYPTAKKFIKTLCRSSEHLLKY